MSKELPYYAHAVTRDNAAVLIFPTSWIGARLPVAPKEREEYDVLTPDLIVTLLDTQDGKEYEAPFWQHYEYSWEGRASVHLYMLVEHYCACHRKIDALAAGADTDEECEGERFVVKSLVPKRWPKLILYSETMTVEELEATLTEGLNTPAE